MALDDRTITGQIFEASEDRVTFAMPPSFVDESTKRNYEILSGLAGDDTPPN
jgi:hypothetical protein